MWSWSQNEINKWSQMCETIAFSPPVLMNDHICVCWRERGAWLGLSDKNSPRVLRWVDGSEVQSGDEGARDRASLPPGNVCVSLDGAGQPSAHSCAAQRAFVCQFTRQGKSICAKIRKRISWTRWKAAAIFPYYVLCQIRFSVLKDYAKVAHML